MGELPLDDRVHAGRKALRELRGSLPRLRAAQAFAADMGETEGAAFQALLAAAADAHALVMATLESLGADRVP